MHHPLLRSGKREWQTVVEERVQQVACAPQHIAPVVAAAVAHVAHDVELDIKELLKLEPLSRPLHLLGVARIVYGAHSRVARHEMERTGDERRERLLKRTRYAGEQGPYGLLHRMRVHSVLLHALGGGIIGL